jgi:hypothetical protein
MSQIKTKFITDNAVTNAKAAQAPANTLKGNNTGSTANQLDLSISDVKTMLGAGSASGLATLDSSGLIPITQIPPAALERLVIVADQTARYALTTATVQNGDTVKQTDTGLMYFVIDQTNLGNSAGYSAYTAGTASSVAWSGITGIPSPVSSLTGTNSGDITLGTANGLSLSGQALSLGTSSSSTTGALSSTDWSTFNSKQSSSLTSAHILVGNGSGVATDVAMSGDVTIDNTGATTIGSLKITAAKMSSGAASSGQVATADGSGGVSFSSPAATSTNGKHVFTSVATSYVDLGYVALTDSIKMAIAGAGCQVEGASYDYTVSYTGGTGGKTRITFVNTLATLIDTTDVIEIDYQY